MGETGNEGDAQAMGDEMRDDVPVERAVDDIHTDWQHIVTIFDQDGFTVDVPEINIAPLCRAIEQSSEWRDDTLT